MNVLFQFANRWVDGMNVLNKQIGPGPMRVNCLADAHTLFTLKIQKIGIFSYISIQITTVEQ